MASGPHWDKRRGTYRIQYHDGYRWRRVTVYKVPGWKEGMPEPKKTPPEAMAALKEYADKERAARANRPLDPEATVDDFLAAFASAYARERAAGSATQLAQAIRTFAEWRRLDKLTKLDQVVPAACQRFIDWRAGQTSRKTGRPISPARLNQEKRLLAAAWSRSARLGEIPSNPWTPTTVPGWEKSRRARKERPHWTPEQFERLLGACRPWLRDVLTLGTQTGLRISALRGLEWRDVRWGGKGLGEIVVRPELDKVGRGYSVPMSSKAHELLARLEVHRPTGRAHVLAAARGGMIRGAVTERSIRRACRLAGLPKPASANHHCRRTFGRWAVLGQLTGRPIPIYVVMRWMGHSNIETTMSYLDLTDSDNHDWMSEVEPQA